MSNKHLSLNHSIRIVLFFLVFISFKTNCLGQNKEEHYRRFLDSTNYYLDEKPKQSLKFLDSIPTPVNNYIHGQVAEYFLLKAQIYDNLFELTKSYKNHLLALDYAEKERDYFLAGEVCIELFLYLYQIEKKEEAFGYLDKAKLFFTKINNTSGLLDVKQMPAYVKFLEHEYDASNELILEHLNAYKNLENRFLYLMAVYMLVSNYIALEDLKQASIYFNFFRELRGEEGVIDEDYFFYERVINFDYAEYYYEKKKFDLALIYMAKTKDSRKIMNHVVIKDYFSLYSKIYKEVNNEELHQAYADSLLNFEKEFQNISIKSSFELTDSLVKSETNLETESHKKNRNLLTAIGLFCIVVILFFSLYKNKKRVVLKIDNFKNKLNRMTYLDSNQQKLTVKVNALEGYIKELKSDIKSVSNVSNIEEQRNLITNLYKKTHIKSSNALDLGQEHIKLINELNVGFFTKIKKEYPKLNESETLVCYYLFMGFKNKDIAFFFNITVRGVESKRYRISKKMGLINSDLTLQECLRINFKDFEKFNI